MREGFFDINFLLQCLTSGYRRGICYLPEAPVPVVLLGVFPLLT